MADKKKTSTPKRAARNTGGWVRKKTPSKTKPKPSSRNTGGWVRKTPGRSRIPLAFVQLDAFPIQDDWPTVEDTKTDFCKEHMKLVTYHLAKAGLTRKKAVREGYRLAMRDIMENDKICAIFMGNKAELFDEIHRQGCPLCFLIHYEDWNLDSYVRGGMGEEIHEEVRNIGLKRKLGPYAKKCLARLEDLGIVVETRPEKYVLSDRFIKTWRNSLQDIKRGIDEVLGRKKLEDEPFFDILTRTDIYTLTHFAGLSESENIIEYLFLIRMLRDDNVLPAVGDENMQPETEQI